MSYFPFFMELEGVKCLIAGGGTVAYRKIQTLLSYGVHMTVVAPDICKELADLLSKEPEQLWWERRTFQEEDVKDKLFVIAATDDKEVNAFISRLCKESNILVNVVDVKEECSFLFPALVKKDELVVGISSGGNSPLLSGKLRCGIEELLPDFYGDLNRQLGNLREQVGIRVSPANRKDCYAELLEQGEKKKNILSEAEIEQIIQKWERKD